MASNDQNRRYNNCLGRYAMWTLLIQTMSNFYRGSDQPPQQRSTTPIAINHPSSEPLRKKLQGFKRFC